jgi:hypothetical protein
LIGSMRLKTNDWHEWNASRNPFLQCFNQSL